MKAIKFKDQTNNPVKIRKLRKILKRLIPITLVISLLMGLAIFLTTLSGSNSVVSYIFSGNNLKSSNGRVNVLLLGIAGGTHDGANLTDTIMVASYDFKSNRLYLFSIPRDLWLPSLKSKANAVYGIGLSQNNGLGLTKTVVGNILGLPIHYALRVDFRGFIQAIDILDGLDIVVDNTFDDYNYPIEGKENDLCGFREEERDFSEEEAKALNIEPGKRKVFISEDGQIATDSAEEDKGAKYFFCRFEHIRFVEGKTQMDGKTALKYVRSRHGTSGEATDFSRSKRQQKVLEAIRNKVLSLETLANPQRVTELIQTFGKSIDTDISVKEAVEFYTQLRKLDKISNFVLDDSPRSNLPEGRKSLLIHPSPANYGGAYVLISEDDDFSIISGYIRKILSGEVSEYEATAAARRR